MTSRQSPSAAWSRRSGRCARSTASTSRSRGAPSSASSVPTGPARPRPCASSRRCSSPTRAAPASPGLDVVADAGALRARIGLAGQYAAVDEHLTGDREPRDGRPPLRHEPPGRHRARRRAARALRPHRRRRARGEDLLRRHAPPARPRGRAGRQAARAVPRRADDGPGPAQPRRAVGDDRGPRRRRHHGPADDAVPRRGRAARRPHRGHRPRPRDRRRHRRRAQGAASAASGSRSTCPTARTPTRAAEALAPMSSEPPQIDEETVRAAGRAAQRRDHGGGPPARRGRRRRRGPRRPPAHARRRLPGPHGPRARSTAQEESGEREEVAA